MKERHGPFRPVIPRKYIPQLEGFQKETGQPSLSSALVLLIIWSDHFTWNVGLKSESGKALNDHKETHYGVATTEAPLVPITSPAASHAPQSVQGAEDFDELMGKLGT